MPWLSLIAFLLFSPLVLGAEVGRNLALRQPVEASGDIWAGLSPASLTDGNASTFCHPLASSGTRDFYFEVDLGAVYQLEEIRVRNRSDGCCPERLTRYRLEVYADGSGEAGALQWTAEIRRDGTHSGVSGVDVITRANNPAGAFAGRFVRIVNASGLAYSPQLSELEIYGALSPTITSFQVDQDTLASGESTVLRWETSHAIGATIDPGGIAVGLAGTLPIQPSRTTSYTLSATNAAGSVTATVLVGVDVSLQPPEITEFLAENGDGLKDEDRDESDWIELRNPNLYSLQTEGLFLTDQPANLTKWRLPRRRIASGGHLIVFASGKSRAGETGELHASFRLDREGDYLALVNTNGVVLQQFPPDYPATSRYPEQMKDVSYGIGSNGARGFMRPPTPGGTNGVAFEGAVAGMKFFPERGFYNTNLLVTLHTATPGTVIRYTTDRSEPTATHGAIYNGPIPVSRTTVLRAATFRAGWSPSAVETHSYIYLSNVISASVMRTNITRNAAYAPRIEQGLQEIPSISLNTASTINGTAEVKTSVEWICSNPAENLQENCGVRHFGGAFTTFAKKNFRLYFRSEYGAPKLEGQLFGRGRGGIAPVEEFDQLELRGGSHDMVDRGFYMANIFADDTLLEMKQLNPHGRFVHLYLNGTYWGVYHLRERWNDAMHESYLGGSRTNYESINGNWNVGGWAEPGSAYDGDGTAWAKVKNLRSNYQSIKPLLDVDQYIYFMIVWMFGGSEDEYRAVGPTTAGSGFKFYLNDADGWFCGPWYCAAGDRTVRSAPGRAHGDGPGSLFSMLFRQAHPDYRTLLADRIYKALFNNGTLTPTQNIARLKARTGEINNAFIAEAARWNYLTPSQWQSRIDYATTNWLARRTAEVLTSFRATGFYPSLAAPVFNQHGGRVAPGFQLQFSKPPRGEVLFTVDGNDPRLPGGALSTSARTGSLSVTGNTFVRARVRDGTQWSALNEAFFQTAEEEAGVGDLVISEINYDPTRRGAEFVELMNISAQAIELNRVELTGGIRFAFSTAEQTALAPGQRMLLVRDLMRFQQWYGLSPAVAGIYAGRLSTEGEEVSLTRGTQVLGRLTYGTAAPWPSLGKDGTLVLAHPEFGLENPQAWRSSVQPGGSPGADDSTRFAGDALADADRDGLPAVIEYAFGTSDLDSTGGRDALMVETNTAGSLSVSFPRNLAADDLVIRCERSGDLVEWEPATFVRSEAIGAGVVRETWRAGDFGANTVFVRVNVVRK